MAKKIIEIKDVTKSFDGAAVVKGISLDVMEGEFLTLLGPSGCGKTTTLRMLAGFEQPDSGTVLIDGEDVGGMPPYKRAVNTVFQNYALFPLMNVYDNIAYGLMVKKLPKDVIRGKVTAALKTVQLEGFEKRKIDRMSGGQKQRVAIARAIVNDPRVLLLDEPLGALDFKLRKQMQLELKRLQKQLGITFIYVTHDQEEAMTMSDRIAVMSGGVIEQVAPPEVIYNAPATSFVADFVGESNIFDVTVENAQPGGACTLTGSFGHAAGICPGLAAGKTARICVRPEAMKLSYEPFDGFDIEGTVTENICAGNLVKILVRVGGEELKCSQLSGMAHPKPGEHVYLHWDAASAALMER